MIRRTSQIYLLDSLLKRLLERKYFLNYGDEIPYSTAALIESFEETDEKVNISATIWIERQSQKPIVIGKGGSSIKKVRLDAQRELRDFVGKPVTIELFVKIKKNWRKNNSWLNELGFKK